MTYEITKLIKGHPYRYAVEGFRDPQTGRSRARWTYLGRVVGESVVAPARERGAGVTRDELTAVVARLLESRDPSHLTVGVIAQHAGISPGTFYRHFPTRQAALGAAFDRLCEPLIAALPLTSATLGSEADERERLRNWFGRLERALRRGRALQRLVQPADRPVLVERLAAYLRALDGAGLVAIDDPAALGVSLLRLHASVAPATPGEWTAVWPLVERAIFRKVAARATESPRSDRVSHHDRNRSPRA